MEEMEEKQEDRRIRRTKKMLRQGLTLLMNEKDFKDITVKELTERIDINRGTFYLHYRDTYDLLEKIENELIEDFEKLIENYEPSQEASTGFVIIEQVFDYITENYEICKTLLLNHSGNQYEKKLLDIICTKGFEINLYYYNHDDKKNTEYKSYFLAYGLIGLVKQWILDDRPIPKKEMVCLVDGLLRKHTVCL